MGIHTVASDMSLSAPGILVSDDYFIASTYDIDKTVGEAELYNKNKRKINGVICVATDVPRTVASVANKLGLPGISMNSAILASNKLLMKKRFLEKKVPIPWFSEVLSLEHLKKILKFNSCPLVLKPIDSRGSRGVFKIHQDMDIDKLYYSSLQHSPTKTLMVERYLSGPQLSTESLILNGKTHTVGLSDRNYEYLTRYAPSIIENGGQLPSALDQTIIQEVGDLIEIAAKGLDINFGVVKGDIVIYNGKAHVIEIAARLSGGYFCTHEIPLNTGVDFVGSAIRLALGLDVKPSDLNPKFQKPVAQRYFFPKPGIVKKIEIPDEFKTHPLIELLEIRVDKGDLIGPIFDHPGRAGVVITTGDSIFSAITLAERVCNEINIETE